MASNETPWLADFRICQPISSGLDEDLKRIIFLVSEQFKKHGGPRFDLVVDIWHQSCLGLIFSGRESFRDLLEFSEEVLGRVKVFALSVLHGRTSHPLVRYWHHVGLSLKSTDNKNISLVSNVMSLTPVPRYSALFLLYSLYWKQPCRPRARIRLVLSELQDMEDTIAQVGNSRKITKYTGCYGTISTMCREDGKLPVEKMSAF